MILDHIATWNFRNLEAGPISFNAGLTVVSGGNGQGKTSLLEAVAVLGTLRSFRSPRFQPMVREGQRFFRLQGRLRTAAGNVELGLGWESGPPSRRRLYLNGVEVDIARYLQVFPMVVLSGPDRELVIGKPEGRRAYLDRLAFLLEQDHLERLRRYRRFLHQRNAALGRGVASREMEVWEFRLAEAASSIVDVRRRVVERLETRFQRIYGQLGGGSFPEVRLDYVTDSFLGPGGDQEELAEIYRKRYNDQRDRDRETGYTTAGPHRHDLMIRGSKGHVRDYLSAGQLKAVAAALRLSFLEEVEEDRGEVLPLAIDDVDAEIDGTVTERILALGRQDRQLLVTSTRSELPGTGKGGARRYTMQDGRVVTASGREEKR